VDGVQFAAGMNVVPQQRADSTLDVMQLDLSSKKLSTITVNINLFRTDIEKVVATAYAQALSGAYTYRNANGCVAWVNAGGCIWTQGHPDEKNYCAGCVAKAYSEGAVESSSAVATAGVPLFFLHLTACMP
jgi:hypothetical protein